MQSASIDKHLEILSAQECSWMKTLTSDRKLRTHFAKECNFDRLGLKAAHRTLNKQRLIEKIILILYVVSYTEQTFPVIGLFDRMFKAMSMDNNELFKLHICICLNF